MMTDLCSICNVTVDKSCLQCDKCNDWINYRCSNLPAYFIITLSDALEHLDQYYKENHLRANPDKTQTCSFHLRNRETKRKLDIKWCNKELLHTSHPVYLGVTLDRTLSYKQHIMKVKGKTAARNNIRKKLSNTKWGTSPSTIKTAALALSYSTAEYACPVTCGNGQRMLRRLIQC